MKFAFISTMVGAPWGGSEDLWSATAAHLLTTGHTVSACVKDWGDAEAEPLQRLEARGLKLFRREESGPPPTVVRVRRKVAEKMGLRRPPVTPLAQLAATRPDFTLVSLGGGFPTDDCCGDLMRHGLAFGVLFQSAAEQDWPGDGKREEAVAVLLSARAALFVSEGNRQLVSRQLVHDHPRSLVVRNPFRVDYDQVIPWPAPAAPWKIAIVGRLEPGAKGCDLALEALARPQWRQRPVEVTFFGTGASALGVQALASRLNLNFVRFAGQVADVAGIWHSHHLLLLPSRFEGLPLAIIEAMLCGRPCVATDVAGNGELIVDGQTGFLAASATINAVAEALERAWAERDNWSRMGAAAAAAIRTLVPRSPAADLAVRLEQLAAQP